MTSLILALQFLTIIPIKIKQVNEKKISQSMVYFPVVGLFLGLLLAGLNNLLLFLNFGQFASSIILIVFLVVITGGIHLDGLADTTDAFLSRKNKEEMLKIMRDPHIGVMGVVGIISVILLKIAFFSSINPSLKPISLILMCVLSRWSLVFLMFIFPYARQEGKAKVFTSGINYKIFIITTIISVVIAFVAWKLLGLLLFVLISLYVYAIGRFLKKKIGGITGDTLGAVNEFAEVFALMGVCILEKAYIWIK